MVTVYNYTALVCAVLLAILGLLLLLDRNPAPRGWGGRLSRALERRRRSSAWSWVDWRVLTAVIAIGYGLVVAWDVTTGLYTCTLGKTSDPIALWKSGVAFWDRGNPFSVADCGTTTLVPYGLAAVLIDAVGSLGGVVGVVAAWGVLAVALVPLTWFAAGADRRYVTLFVVLLPIYFPLVSVQIDGASNSILPVAVLVTIVLGSRAPRLAEFVGGLLATARFPTVLPLVASRGPERRPLVGGLVVVGTFAAGTGVAYAVWGPTFYHDVFGTQISRRSFSLNAYGPFLDHGTLPTGLAIIAVEGALVLAITAAAFFGVRSRLRAAGLALVGYAIVTPFLSFSILLSLVPLALLGHRTRWWLWLVATVGALNYDYALNLLAWNGGSSVLSEALDLVLTGALIGLFLELWNHRAEELPDAGSPGSIPSA